MGERKKIVDTMMYSTPKEVTEYINSEADKAGFKYETRKIDDNLYKVEKFEIIQDNRYGRS